MDTTRSVTTTALARAIGLLTALKAEYIIKLPDLDLIVHGSMQLMPIKPPKPARKRRESSAPHGAYTNFCRAKGVDKMQVGDVLSFTTDGLDVHRVRGVAGSLGAKLYGNDSVMTVVRGGIVEIMRIA